MKIKNILPIMLSIIGFNSKLIGQKATVIKVIDSVLKKAISNVHVINNNKIIGFTDYSGVFLLNKEYDTISLSHIGYNEKKIPLSNVIQKNDTISLSPINYELEEVVIDSSKKNIFYGYFRGWQTSNGKLKYYVDGICSYKNKKNGTIERKIHSYRSFKNDSLINARKKRFIEIDIGFVFPELFSKEKLEKTLSYFDTENLQKQRGKSNIPIKILNKQRGKYSVDDYGNMTYYEYNQFYDSTYISSKLGYRQRKLHEYYLNAFKDYGSKYFNSFQKKFNLSEIKHKKDEEFNKIATTFEIYILEENLDFNSKPKNKYKLNQSYYRDDFWSKYIEKYPLQKAIVTSLNTLDLAKNKFKK